MHTDVVLPNLGFGMEEGRLISWLKKVGETVKKGEAIAEVESDKTTVELEATVDGILTEILQAADQVVPVGTVLAHIETGGAASTVATPAAVPSQQAENLRVTPLAKRAADQHGIDLSTVKGTGFGGKIVREDIEALKVIKTNGERPLAAPAIRKLAHDHQIDLRVVRPTGYLGQVTRADLEMLINAAVSAPAPVKSASPVAIDSAERQEINLSTMRQAIARRLVQSTQEAPHFYITTELDLTDALAVLPKEIGINNLLLYLTVQTLKDIPDLNATYENGHLYHYNHVNLALAVALPTGLITPVLHHADDYSLSGIAGRARELITRARENRLRPEELSGGTFTISNLGMIKQIDHFTAIINPPQVAILAVGAAKPRPIVINGGLHIRTTVHLTLSVDHRIVDGLGAAKFLEAFANRLESNVDKN